MLDVQSSPPSLKKSDVKNLTFFCKNYLTCRTFVIIIIFIENDKKMGMTKRLLEEIIDEELYSCDMDYEYQLWVENKQLQDQEEYMKNYLETQSAYEEMLADRY